MFQLPNTQEEWQTIARGFENKWNFPNCLGAVDGKHIRIIPPAGSGSAFWNYKHFHSLVLIACANSNYEFIWCEIGTNGRISDGGVLKNTEFYEKLVLNELNIPPPQRCTNSTDPLPFVFVGDEAFSLRHDFMKPFSQKTLNNERRVFNYRLSRARRIIENVFGILANRFRIFHSAINLKLHRIEIVTLCCCVLHNFLRKTCFRYFNEDDIEEEQSHFENSLVSLENNPRNTNARAKLVREMYVEYFNGDGAVHWQNG